MHPNKIRNNEILDQMVFDDIYKIYPSGFKFKTKFKRELWRAHDKKCAYCGIEVETHMDMHVDHYQPKSLFENHEVSNLVCACRKCNLTKGNRDLDDFRFCFSLSDSILNGVIQACTAKRIINAGVNLPIIERQFYFEKILLGSENV